jgi:hypothetical protein
MIGGLVDRYLHEHDNLKQIQLRSWATPEGKKERRQEKTKRRVEISNLIG